MVSSWWSCSAPAVPDIGEVTGDVVEAPEAAAESDADGVDRALAVVLCNSCCKQP